MAVRKPDRAPLPRLLHPGRELTKVRRRLMWGKQGNPTGGTNLEGKRSSAAPTKQQLLVSAGPSSSGRSRSHRSLLGLSLQHCPAAALARKHRSVLLQGIVREHGTDEQTGKRPDLLTPALLLSPIQHTTAFMPPSLSLTKQLWLPSEGPAARADQEHVWVRCPSHSVWSLDNNARTVLWRVVPHTSDQHTPTATHPECQPLPRQPITHSPKLSVPSPPPSQGLLLKEFLSPCSVRQFYNLLTFFSFREEEVGYIQSLHKNT